MTDSPIFLRFKDPFEDSFSVTCFGINRDLKCQNKITRKKISWGILQVIVPQPSSKYTSRILVLCLQSSMGNTRVDPCSVNMYWVYAIARYVSYFLGETFKKACCLFIFISLFEWFPNTSFLQGDISLAKKECVCWNSFWFW